MKPADRLSALLAKLDEDSRPDRQVYRDLVRTIRPFGRHNGILDIIHREIRPMARKRRAVEQEAWHLAVSLRLPVAALPWPLSPDDDGNLSLREHELLWWHLMGRGDPWSRIDARPLHELPPWPANPVLCALWRSATRQGLDTLTDCHRATVSHASSMLGLASLVLEEARHRADHDQTVEPFIVIDEQFVKRFSLRPEAQFVMLRFTTYYADALRAVGNPSLPTAFCPGSRWTTWVRCRRLEPSAGAGFADREMVGALMPSD